jgi:UDP-N-acetylglucosamine 2-epimerase (non-hydrolysing)
MRLLVALGTRPEFVKMAPVLGALRQRGHVVITVATGQHYDKGLADDFFRELDLEIDERWELCGDEAARVGEILTRAYAAVADHRPDAVLVLGDTHTVPLFCLAARRQRVPVVHLEAGLRSFNEGSMEEVNRRVAAATATLHLAPTALAAEHLRAEGVDDRRIRVVGNPVIDAIRGFEIERRPFDARCGVVATFHRASNVDDPVRLRALVELLGRLQDDIGQVTFPVHPRTRRRLEETGLDQVLGGTGILACEPVPYSEMLALLAGSKVVVTDSGGLQEEAAWFGVPVVVLRNSTPRWESVVADIAVLVGTDIEAAMVAAKRLSTRSEAERVASTPCPYGEGDTAQRVVDVFDEPGMSELLTITEPAVPMAWPR